MDSWVGFEEEERCGERERVEEGNWKRGDAKREFVVVVVILL